MDPKSEPLTALPGVQVTVPPLQYLSSLSDAIEAFSKATLRPGETGGLMVVTTYRPGDGKLTANLVVVGKKNAVLAWIGKEGSWGEPWEVGFAWQRRW